jgi:hypothetical protein
VSAHDAAEHDQSRVVEMLVLWELTTFSSGRRGESIRDEAEGTHSEERYCEDGILQHVEDLQVVGR